MIARARAGRRDGIRCARRVGPATARATHFTIAVDTPRSADAVFTRPAVWSCWRRRAGGPEYAPASIVRVSSASDAGITASGPALVPASSARPGLHRLGDTLLTLNAGNQRIER